MAASDVRLVGLELQLDVAALKAAVDALSTAVDAIDTVTSAWAFDGLDNTLPTASAVKTQLAAYTALSTGSVTKSAVSINDSVTVINAAT